MRRFLILLLILPVFLVQGRTVLRSRFDSVLVAPGGLIRFRIVLFHDRTDALVSVSTNSFHKDLEFAMNSPDVRDSADGRKVSGITGQLQVFAISNVQFDGLKVVFRENGKKIIRIVGRTTITVVTPPVNFKKKPLILPAKGPLGYPRSYTLLLIIAVILFLLGGFLFWWVRRRRNNRPAVIPGMNERIDPWELVGRRLDFLRDRVPESDQDVKDFYFELTETVRIYLHGRTGLHFEETTTSELLTLLNEVPWIQEDEGQTLVSLFQDADLVKFARFRPEGDSIRSFFSNIESWLMISNGEYMRYQAVRQGGGS